MARMPHKVLQHTSRCASASRPSGPHGLARLRQGAKDKAPAKGAAKRAKKGAAEQAGAPAPEGGSEPQEQAAMEVDADSGDMDAAVAHALDASEGGAEPPPAVTAVAQQPAARGEPHRAGCTVCR